MVDIPIPEIQDFPFAITDAPPGRSTGGCTHKAKMFQIH
jgi:hypothetical protein